MGVSEIEISYLSSTLNTDSENVYEVEKRWHLVETPPEYLKNS